MDSSIYEFIKFKNINSIKLYALKIHFIEDIQIYLISRLYLFKKTFKFNNVTDSKFLRFGRNRYV